MPFQPASQALSRFTVLDLTRVRSGPTCVRQLGDWGANVIKVEMPEALEADGALGAGRDTPDFKNLQRNKRSLTLNLKAPEGVATFKRLVEKADVVVENFRADVKFRLGLDYETLAKINPRLVYASISGFGQDGPDGDRPGFDQVVQGVGGLMSITGLPGQGPVRVGIPIADLSSGVFASFGIAVALLEREVSGKGQWVKTSLLEAQIFMLDFQAARWLIGKEVPPQAGNDHPTMIPTGVFTTSDGHINIACAGQAFWLRLAKALNADELTKRPEYIDAKARSKNRAALNVELNNLLKDKPSRHWVKFLNEAGVPTGEINTIDQVFADPQVKHLKIAEPVDVGNGKTEDVVRQPIEMTRTPSRMVRRAPLRGEHTDEVLAEFGFSAAEIKALRAGGVV
ncbi:MAG: CoA transferase [Rhodospirillales bacterium]|nr:CoA transferase [Rhodospirillales bacterium]